MKRHYIKIPPSVAQWVPDGDEGDWRSRIVRDVTGGDHLVVEPMPSNDLGVRAAVHGDHYYIEIGRDRDPNRSDTVFLMRIESADQRLPRRSPVRRACEMKPWPGGTPPVLDSVDDLFGARFFDEPDVEARTEQAPEASPLLKRILSTGSGGLRMHVRPGSDVQEPDGPTAFLQPFRQLWSRLRLDRYVQLSPRHEALITGLVKPQSLPPIERAGLKAAFGIELLHRVAIYDESRVLDVAHAIAAMPIRATDRAAIWIATLDSLSSADLRRELHDSIDALTALSREDTVNVRAWRSIIAPGLVDLARTRDDELRDAVEDSDEPPDVLQAVIAWARELAFREEQPRSESTPAGTDEPSERPTAVTSEPTFQRADHWVIRLRLPDGEAFENLHSVLVRAAELRRQPATLVSIDDVTAFHALAEEVETHFRQWRETVGNVNELRRDLEEASVALHKLEQVAGPDASSIIDKGVTPRDVTEIASLLENPALRCAPDWLLWPSTDQEQTSRPQTETEWATVLVDAERRGLVRLFCELAVELDEPGFMDWIPEPAPTDDLERHLRESFLQVRDFLREVPPELRLLVEQEERDLRLAQDGVVRLRQLKMEVPADLWTSIDDHLRSETPAARSALLGAYERAVAFFREEIGSLDGLTPALLKGRVAKELTRESGETTSSLAAGRMTVEHNFVEGRARATLMFAPAETGEDYGVVTVPLVLETDQPQAVDVRLEWDFKGDARTAWPSEWPAPEPSDNDVVAVPMYAWHRQSDGTKWHYPLVARLPIRTPKGKNPHIAVAVTVVEAQKGTPLGNKRVLRWDSIGLEPHTISVVWGDATEPSHVRAHPIGPQGQADAIRDRFVAGGSVAVIAPRRFGKSTLVEYLVTEGSQHKLLIPPAIVCTRYASASGFDYERLWNEVSSALVDEIGVRLKRESTSALPAAEAFDAVRTTAKRKNYKAVVLLFDEAQLFFQGQNGIELGSAMKTLLERHLARRSDDTKVPLLFGLIGLPSLRLRAGSDLMGLLNPVEETRMDESELRPLIAKMTNGLETTRGARQRLAATAGNLLILRALLEKLARRASRDRRVWVNFADVAAVEEALKRDLQNGLEQTVASYIRDVLNAADRVDDWQPVPSLPTAAAWAKTWTPSRSETEIRARALAVLNEWCQLSQGDEQHRLVYTPEALERDLQQLRERRVLDGLEFVSALLQAWLLSTARRVGSDAAFHSALFSGAQRRINIPEGASRIAQGAQAVIWRYEEYAYRTKELADEQERQRFLESTDMLEALQQIVQRREAGSDHVFDLVDMGLSAQNERQAVQVYRWIPGRSLAGREGALAADIVIELGAKLARGLRLLHKNNILHRDIHPRNIVLDDISDPTTLRPVLIDFGFARIETRAMHTAIVGDHVAPEVQGAKPEWTRAADVYALGSTLRSLVSADEQAVDLRLLDKAMSSKPDERPTAEVLLEGFRVLELERRIDERRDDAWRELWNLVGEHRHIPWFSAQMNKMQESLVALALGFYRTPASRYGVVANFLNQLAESNPMLRNSLWGLGQKKTGADSELLKTLGALRNHHSHARGNQPDEQRVLVDKFLDLAEPKRRTYAERSAEIVAQLAQLRSLPDLVKRLVASTRARIPH